MGYSVFPVPQIDLPPSLNKSQVFTSSGTFTAPAGVSYVKVYLRGGDGSNAGLSLIPTENSSSAGASGGSTSAFGVSATGGAGSVAAANSSGSDDKAYGLGALSGADVTFFADVTASSNYTITVGSGSGAIAVVSWAE